MSITKQQAEWQTVSGFIQLFFSKLNAEKKPKDAYEEAETDYKKVFARRRYINWDSFRQVKHRYYASRK